jgi:hypothetical protein
LNILEQCVPQWYPGQTLSTLGPANPLFWHALIETKKLAYADTYAFNADPDVVSVPVGALTVGYFQPIGIAKAPDLNNPVARLCHGWGPAHGREKSCNPRDTLLNSFDQRSSRWRMRTSS